MYFIPVGHAGVVSSHTESRADAMKMCGVEVDSSCVFLDVGLSEVAERTLLTLDVANHRGATWAA